MSQALSELGLDLALSHARLTAAKAKSNIAITLAERASVSQLCSELSRRLDDLNRPNSLPATLVAGDDQLRSRLEEAMNTLAPVRQEPLALHADLVRRMLPTLEELGSTGKLPSSKAAALLEELLQLVPPPDEVAEPVMAYDRAI